MQARDLVGKFYPVFHIISKEIVGYQIITFARDIDNKSGYYVEFNDSKEGCGYYLELHEVIRYVKDLTKLIEEEK